MRRGEIRLVALGSHEGGKASAQRPAVIVSNDGANAAAARRGRGVVTIVPLTTSQSPARPFQVLIPAGAGGLPRAAKALAEHVRTIDAHRVGPSIGALPLESMRELDAALKIHLGL